jgi:hypothetical protein
MYALLMLGKVPSQCLKSLFRTVSLGSSISIERGGGLLSGSRPKHLVEKAKIAHLAHVNIEAGYSLAL